MCIPRTTTWQCAKPSPDVDEVLETNLSNRQRPVELEREVNETSATLTTNRESGCIESVDVTEGWRLVRRYAS